jgi:hypothetical protein
MTMKAKSQDRTPEEQVKCDNVYAEVKANGVRRKGMAYYEKFLAGGRLTLLETLLAKCWECNGYGESDTCASPTCPNFPYFMQVMQKSEP